MHAQKHSYLLYISYLGYRYHGWQKQQKVKTVQYMLDRTLITVLEHDNFRTMAAGRTDAMVSALNQVVLLTSRMPIDTHYLFNNLKKNLPSDIDIHKVEIASANFDIINHTKKKEYHYNFSYGDKAHPFCAPTLVHFKNALDINAMQEAASLFEGIHNFKLYCYRAKDKTTFEREIFKSELVKSQHSNSLYFPKNCFTYKVVGEGFLHHQVRLMMGTLVKVGLGELSSQDIEESFKGNGDYPIGFIAPASGLVLYKTEFTKL